MLCERCKKPIYSYVECYYCKRKICYSCVKSQKKVGKQTIYICKDCWQDISKRKGFKALSEKSIVS